MFVNFDYEARGDTVSNFVIVATWGVSLVGFLTNFYAEAIDGENILAKLSSADSGLPGLA